MALKLITAPAHHPVSLDEAKSHLRIDHDEEDTLIAILMAAATRYSEKFLGRALIDQTWELTIDEFPDNEVKIPLPPLIEVVSVKHDDGNGDEQTLTEGLDYTVDLVSEPGWILPNSSWPSTFDGINAVRIRFRGGYLDETLSPAEDIVPGDIKSAILLYLGTLYAHRETIVIGQTAAQLPWASEQLLRMHRIDLSMA